MKSRDSSDSKNGTKFDNKIIFDQAFDHFRGRGSKSAYFFDKQGLMLERHYAF